MMIKEIADSQVFLLTLTVGVYIGAMWLRRKVNWALLHPIFVSIVVLIAFLRLSGIEYEHYMRQTQVIDFLLGLSVVALGYILHDQIYNIRGNVISIVVAILVGSAVGIVSVALIARWMGAEPAVVASLEPKSVTTAIALSVSANSGDGRGGSCARNGPRDGTGGRRGGYQRVGHRVDGAGYGDPRSDPWKNIVTLSLS